MRMSQPLLSVIIGVYCQKHDVSMLMRSIDSILRQSVSDFEFLICDDGSSNEVVEYLDRAADKDDRIVLVRKGNLFTLPQKLNACLAAAKGKYIARMDDDDFSHHDRFLRQIEFLEKHPDISFCGCNVNLIRNGEYIGQRRLPEYPNVEDFYFVQPYIHPSLIFRREALEAVAGYSEDKYSILCEDYDILLRLYAGGYKGANIQQQLFDYTVSSTAKGSRKMKHRINEAVTRYRRFKQLGKLPKAFIYVIKPIAVGIIPESVLYRLKQKVLEAK